MSFTNLFEIIKKFDDRHKKNYDLFTDIIGKLQPIAFLISVSLVLAVFFFNNNKDSISGKYALFASLTFFLAYLGFAFYKIFNYRLSLYWALSIILIGVYLIYYSFGDVLSIILSIGDKKITLLVTYIVYSMIILVTKYISNLTDENNFRYKISKLAVYIQLLFLLIYAPIGIYLSLSVIPMFVIVLIFLLVLFLTIV